MSESEITVQMPDVDLSCPKCNSDMQLSGYDFEPTYSLKNFAKAPHVFCDRCQTEFCVYLGGE